MINCEFENGNKASLRHGVVHDIVVKDNKILLEKRADNMTTEPSKWALPGGFIDRDETAEKAAVRELLEETGLTGKVISMLRINTQPNRPNEDRQNIALDFIVEPIEQVGVGDKEVSDLQWFSFDELPPNLAFDHQESIDLYISYIKEKFTIPVWQSK